MRFGQADANGLTSLSGPAAKRAKPLMYDALSTLSHSVAADYDGQLCIALTLVAWHGLLRTVELPAPDRASVRDSPRFMLRVHVQIVHDPFNLVCPRTRQTNAFKAMLSCCSELTLALAVCTAGALSSHARPSIPPVPILVDVHGWVCTNLFVARATLTTGIRIRTAVIRCGRAERLPLPRLLFPAYP